MLGQDVKSNIELERCIENEQVLEIWIEGELEERCLILSFNDETIKTVEGCYYRRDNIIMLKGKATKVYKFEHYNETVDK